MGGEAIELIAGRSRPLLLLAGHRSGILAAANLSHRRVVGVPHRALHASAPELFSPPARLSRLGFLPARALGTPRARPSHPLFRPIQAIAKTRIGGVGAVRAR